MSNRKENSGVYQLKNGYWAYRYVITVDGKRKERKKTTDEQGRRFKTKKQALKSREVAINREKNGVPLQPIKRRTIEEVFSEYCEVGRLDKAYGTIRKQDSLWNNHLKPIFGKRYVDEITVAEINDYLSHLYYTENRSFSYVESFLKMFYLILGQAYSRNCLGADMYSKLCLNKDSRIKMPKKKIEEDDDVVVFSDLELEMLDRYFESTNIYTAYLLGRYCGLRINECFGLKWSDIDFDNGTVSIQRQMQYIDGLIKLVPLKTRNAKRTIVLSDKLYEHLRHLKNETANCNDTLLKLRIQKSTMVYDINGELVSSLELINSLPNGKIQTNNSMKYHTRKIRDLFGITFRYHYLRHTYGTKMAEMNTPTHLLCNQMGHASIKVTERYYLTVSDRGKDILKNNLNKL